MGLCKIEFKVILGWISHRKEGEYFWVWKEGDVDDLAQVEYGLTSMAMQTVGQYSLQCI